MTGDGRLDSSGFENHTHLSETYDTLILYYFVSLFKMASSIDKIE